MTGVEYPWRCLAEAVGTTFALRYPWLDAVRRAAACGEGVCILLPEVAGDPAEWEPRLVEWIPGACAGAGDLHSVSRALAEAFQVEVGAAYTDGRPAEWANGFLAECRRQMPHVETVPLLAIGADDDCAAGLQDLVRAQRALGYPFARPILLRKILPPGWVGEVVRFGLPEWGGDLHRITPPPARDVPFWTNLLLALTAAWEAGATPRLADQLWEELSLERRVSLRDGGFDKWLDRRLDDFARRNAHAVNPPLPLTLAREPTAKLDDRLWQCGAVAWHGAHFDVTPFQARLWVGALADEDDRESLRRRRLANAPLARWLSAWAASIEESLRMAVLLSGSSKFRRFLETQPPRQRRNGLFRSRWEELDPEDDHAAVDAADFGDLADFVSGLHPNGSPSRRLPAVLEQCRMARNRVVHERRVSAADLLRIADAVEWFAERGLI